jgi:hypothetical protein
MHVVLIIPIFDDWQSAALLCEMIDSTFQKQESDTVTILLVDDGSFVSDAAARQRQDWRAIQTIHILRLSRNVGHQAAIAVGLAWVEHHLPCEAVVILDGDGEDLPQDIPVLLAKSRETGGIVFAERGRRVEGLRFRLGYLVYRTAHRILTGRGIRFGNFSAIPFEFVRRLTAMSELWGHYAATVINARIPYRTVRLARGRRLAGTSRMNLESLVFHGLAAVAVYQTVGVRILLASVAVPSLLLLAVLVLASLSAASLVAIPGWALLWLPALLVLIAVVMSSSLLFVFLSLAFRRLMGILPTRDYVHFVERRDLVFARIGAAASDQ